jgi:hypothetical protein
LRGALVDLASVATVLVEVLPIDAEAFAEAPEREPVAV